MEVKPLQRAITFQYANCIATKSGDTKIPIGLLKWKRKGLQRLAVPLEEKEQ
jgi:hypothetical protein